MSITRAILCYLIVITPLAYASTPTQIKTDLNTRNAAECSAREQFIKWAIGAYISRFQIDSVRSESGAVDYVLSKSKDQNLKPKESKILIQRTVKYVYEVLQPTDISPLFPIDVSEEYYKLCMFKPESTIRGFFVVDLNKAFSKYTDGNYTTYNKDGSSTVCHKGKCEFKQPRPPSGIGQRYDDLRVKIQALGWAPNPTALKPILIRTGQLSIDGEKPSGGMYGNCQNENSTCDKEKPELADCTDLGRCAAVWVKDGETVWYEIENGLVTAMGSSPKKEK